MTPRPIDRAWLLVVVLGAASVLVVATVVAHRAANRATLAARRSVDQRIALRAVLEAVLDAETGQRGFLLTEDPAYLEPYKAALAEIGARLDHAATLLADTAPAVVPGLRPPIAAKLDVLQETVESAQRGEREDALRTVRSGVGRRLMDDVRRKLAAADAVLQAAVEQEREDANTQDRNTTWIAVAAGLTLLVGAILGWSLRQKFIARAAFAVERDAILAELPVGVALVDSATGETLFVNRELLRLRPANAPLVPDAAGVPWPIKHRDGTPFERGDLPIVRAMAGEHVATEAIIAHEDRVIPVLASAVPLRLPRPSVLLTISDITMRERAEAQRQQTLAHLDALFENIPIGIAFLDRDLRYVRVNQVLAELGAKDPDQYAGKTVPEVFGAVGEHYLPVFEKARSGEATLNIQSEHVLPVSPEPRWYLSGFFPVRVPDGDIIGVGAVSTDITELKRTQAILEATFEQAAVGIAHVTVDGRWERVNRRLCEIVGYTEAELQRKTFQDITEPDDLAADLARAQAVLAGELSTYTLEKRYIKRDGSRVWVRLAVSLVRHADGSPQYFITIIEDIDARKRAEAELAALNRELEMRVAQRTQRLAELNEELEAFSYSVSHDLRAPLRAVSSYCQILQEEHASSLDEQGKDAAARARAAALRMGRLIDDMLALSRITRAEIQRAPVDLSAIAGHILDELREHTPRPNVTTFIEPGLTVVGDERLLTSALRNLLGNAWKFTAHCAAPCIEVRCEQRDGEQVFLVTDNGAGFDMKYVGRLFSPFQRLHTQSSYEGTGIGLATVKRVIAKHGGRVWVDRAAVQQGTTIAFTLGGVAA
jgi:PAS domain S-box-containing protein